MSNGRIARGPGCWAASLQSSTWRIVCTRTQVLGSYDGVIATSDSESATTWTSWATDLQGDASRTNRAQTRRRMIRVYFPVFCGPSRQLPELAPSARLAIRRIAPLSSQRPHQSPVASSLGPQPEGNFPRRGEKSPRRRRCGHTDFLIHDEIASVVVAGSSRGRWHMCCPAVDHDDQHDDEHAWATTQN